MNIEIVSGSARKASLTHRLALFLQKVLSEKTDHTVNIIDVRDWTFDQSNEGVYSSEEKAIDDHKSLAKRMFAADAFILVSPEYNGSFSPHLKNLFDHFPKQVHKSFAIVSGSPGGLGGIRACLQLQLLVSALYGVASPFMLVTPQADKKFSEKGELVDESFQATVDTFVNEFLWLSERMVTKVTTD